MISPRFLLKKLQSYIRFKELAKSIKLVAMSLLANLKKKIASRGLALGLITPFFTFLPEIEDYKKAIVVPIGVDKSMCGPHNANIFSTTDNLIKMLKEKTKKFEIVALGSRVKDYFKRNHKSFVSTSILNIDKEPLSADVANIISEKVLSKNGDLYFLIFNRYFSPFLQKTVSYEIPGIEYFIKGVSEYANQAINTAQSFFHVVSDIITNTYATDLTEMYNYCFSLVLLDALEENEYSGVGARIISMENSIQNATSVITIKTLIYNKARQSAITNELIEIITCANSLDN